MTLVRLNVPAPPPSTGPQCHYWGGEDPDHEHRCIAPVHHSYREHLCSCGEWFTR